MSTTIQRTERSRARVVGPLVGIGKPAVREAWRGWNHHRALHGNGQPS